MFETIRSFVPLEWQRPVEFLGTPLWWIPDWQRTVLDFSVAGGSAPATALGLVFLVLPAALVVLGVWVTALSVYSLPFRRERGGFVTALTLTWWNAAGMIWFYWAGVVRMLFVALGWVWGLARLAVRVLANAVRALFTSPLHVLDWTTRQYFQPGVPWIAFLLTLGWSGLEATIFTYTLQPTIYEVLADITGFEPRRAVVTLVLWLLLFLLIAGSFACLQVLGEAVRSKQVSRIAQMVTVELFVMFFEVVFLYRELIDAITPWIAQQSGGRVQMGLVSTLMLAAFGWLGIRAMTWFLFGRYGTGALVAVVSRETMVREGTQPVAPPPGPPAVWADAVAALRQESEWFRREGQYAFELLTLPVLQLFAAAVNFLVVAIRSQPVFSLPFASMADALAAMPLAHRLEGRTGGARYAVETAKGGAR